jgi:hypothetical protein
VKFLGDIELRPISLSGLEGCRSIRLALGKGPQPLAANYQRAYRSPRSGNSLAARLRRRRRTKATFLQTEQYRAWQCIASDDPRFKEK